MTREQIKSKIRMSVTVDRNHIDSLKNADEIIDKIFDDHEAIIKAKDEEIDLLKFIVEESIKKPMGVEPHSWSNYKMLKDKQ